MSVNFVRMCCLLIQDNFGPVIAAVATVLLNDGRLPLAQIVQKSKLPTSKVKESLKVLIQHNLASYQLGSQSKPIRTYSMSCEDVIVLIRYPKFLEIAQKIGPDVYPVLEEMMQGGQVSVSKVLFVIGLKFINQATEMTDSERLSELSKKLKVSLQALHTLAKKRYIIRSGVNSDSYQTSSASPESYSKHLFSIPPVDVDFLVSKLHLNSSSANANDSLDSKLLWKINVNQFYDEMKNEILVDTLNDKFSGFFDARSVLEAIIKLGAIEDSFAEETYPVNYNQIRFEMQRNEAPEKIINDLEDRLRMLAAHSNGILNEVESIHGSSYTVDMNLATEILMSSLAEMIINQRHGIFALRIFRLIKTHKYCNQEKIGQLSMLPAKDAKQITYKLIEDHFVCLKEMRKSYAATAQNNKVEYCFYVDLQQTAYVLRESCYKGISNAKLRAEEEKLKCKRLTGKQEKIDRILLNMMKQNCSEEQLNEIQELITPPEQIVLNRLDRVVDQLTTSMFTTDHTLFMISTYLYYADRTNKRKAMKPSRATRKD